MERRPPVTPSDEIDLYVRTYSSLLRSTGEVRVRAFEEAHAFCGSSLHPGALSPTPDVSAFAYAAARLPDDMPTIDLVVLGQSHELFEAAGYDVQSWRTVKTRGRRRPLRLDGDARKLAVFIASESDIDDFIPILTAFQIEWNKMHERLRALAGEVLPKDAALQSEELARYLGISVDEVDVLAQAFGGKLAQGIANIAGHPLDVNIRLLAASYSQYQRAAQRWWSAVEPHYVRNELPRRRPVYFISSNTHAIANLIGGYARTHKDAILAFGRETNPEGLADTIAAAQERGTEEEQLPFLYYLLRGYIHAGRGQDRMREVRAFEASAGLTHLSEPGHVDVDAQIIEIGKIDPKVIDPRLSLPGMDTALRKSDAVIINIDYPLGMAAYHLMSRIGQGVGEIRGVYVMGKAATLNGRVGDVALSGMVFDEHSRNTYLLRNAFGAKDVRPYLRYGSVFDNQSALTVRSAFLQNRNYMSAFYRDGYTVLEMEAGPFLSAVYELVHPTRIPQDEIVNLTSVAPFDVGFVHYASDTPYSRRQSLLSKSLSYFGVDSTYACAIAIVRRIFSMEIERNS
ncbi:DUF6909 family protein [Pendulispora albinea]|uniref:Uncharacterized protein n=1 Tax=Pendulispora albinea TaxID=2741071 RepID=A0ABZ2LTP2_9BACT